MTTYESTEEFAKNLKVKGASVRRSLCVNGHYLGIRPVKLPNNRLLWPSDERERLMRGENPGSEMARPR
jgi:hypothetical protein